MATLTFNGETYTVDHAVQGTDYIHGYDGNNNLIVSFEGCSAFTGFTYDGTYQQPGACLQEGCNNVKCMGTTLKKADGTAIKTSVSTTATLSSSGWNSSSVYTLSNANITATNVVELVPATTITADQYAALAAAQIVGTAQSSGSMTLKALGTKPTVNIPVILIFRGDL